MKLLIADDHTLFRDALVQYIERSDPMCQVTLAKDMFEALSKLEENPHHDLVILDLRMPGMNGIDGFKRIRDRFPEVPVALMSGIAEPEDVQMVLRLGAVGYFPKTMSGKALLNGIRQIIAGEVFVPEGKENESFMPSYYSDTGHHKVEHDKNGGTQVVGDIDSINCTPRELEVLSFLVEGASNKEIATALDLKVVTVKLHVRGICRKLNAKNRTQAALMAKEMGVRPVSYAH